MTFEVKLLITFVATQPLVILTKFGQNPMKHVEEETNCEKKEERGWKKPQERNKLGETPNLKKKKKKKKKKHLHPNLGNRATLMSLC